MPDDMRLANERGGGVSHRKPVRYGWLLALNLAASLIFAACGGYAPPNVFSVMDAALRSGVQDESEPETGAVTPTPLPAPAQPSAPQAGVQQDPASESTLAESATVEGAAVEGAAAAPVALLIPAIHLGAEVTPMMGELSPANDAIITEWDVPLDTVGWAATSAEAGSQGNVILIGQQALGSALFRPLALGEAAVGQEIYLSAADGVTHLYRIIEVSPPIPAIGATVEEAAQAAAYLAPSATGRLTLVSGWPADVTTHRLFVAAEYVGEAP